MTDPKQPTSVERLVAELVSVEASLEQARDRLRKALALPIAADPLTQPPQGSAAAAPALRAVAEAAREMLDALPNIRVGKVAAALAALDRHDRGAERG